MASHLMDIDAASSASTSAKIATHSHSEISSSASGFQFVNISEPTEIHGSLNRRLVRSSVAQNYRKQQLLKHSAGSPHACIDSDVASMFPVLNFCPVCGYSFTKNRRSSNSLDRSTVSTVQVREEGLNNLASLGAGRIDPFGVFPIPVQPYMHILVDHYVANYSATFRPYGKWDITTSPIITKLFRGFALQQPVYFHATLCIAATHLAVALDQASFQEVARYHRGEAIKLLNAMLEDTTHGVTDLMIAVVGSLANHDVGASFIFLQHPERSLAFTAHVMVGDRTALNTHHNGLVEMIKQRGGIHHHSLMCLLRYRSIWIDLISAVFTHTTPLLPDDAQYMPSRQIEIVSIADTKFYSLVTSSVLVSPMIETVEELFSLTREVLRLRGMRPSPEEMKSTTSRRARVERALYISQFDVFTRGGEIQHCIRLAGIIYANIVFRKTPNGSAIYSAFTVQLQLELEKTNMLSLWDENIEALLWVLFLGGMVVPRSQTTLKEWYTSWLILICHQLEMHMWEEVLEVLRGYLWSEDDLERSCKLLWGDVVVKLRFT